jgi:hypothetical protein
MKVSSFIVAGAITASASLANASFTTLANIGFESSEGYVLGDLYGQNGWADTGDTANVNSVRASSGTRSVSVNALPIPGAAWWWPATNFDTSASPNMVMIASVDMYLESSGTHSANWGLDCYDGDAPYNRISGLWVNADGFANYWDGTTSVVTATSVSYDAWNKLTVIMDYKTLLANFMINNVTIASGISLTAGISPVFGDADFNVQGAQSDTAYFDNYSVVASDTIPAPGAVGLLAASSLVAFGRRRRN